SQTWQVVRSEFDLLMLRNAQEHGVQVHEAARVLDVLFDDGPEKVDRSPKITGPVPFSGTGHAVGVRVPKEGGRPEEVRAKVAVVAPFDYLFKGRGSHEQVYREEVEACPAVRDRLAPARRVAGYFATKDYSYRSKQVAGDGWVLVGDAFGFLDPLYSSGVLLALKSGEMAADAIAEGLQKGDLSAAQLGKWGPLFNRGVDRMRRLVCEYYDGFSFGKFVK